MGRTSFIKAFNQLVFFVLAAVLFTGCSTDPNRRKLSYLKDGERYVKSGKYQEAVIQFRNALEIDPRFAAAHYELGRAYLALKNPDSAYRELTEAVTLDPANSDAQIQLATLLLGRRQLDQAQSLAQKVLAAEPGNARAHAILGEKYTLTRDFPKAIQEFLKVVEIEPQRVENYGALGAVYRAAGQLSEAEATYRKAITANPKSAPAHIALSQFFFSMGKMAEAEIEMRAACDLDSHAIPPRIFLARIYLAMGRTTEVENLYAALKTIAPGDPQAYQALGTFYTSTGQKEKAAAEFRMLLKAHPKDNSIKAYLVETLLDLNRTGDAAPLIQEILTANPTDPRGLLAQGRLLLAQGQFESAVATLQKAVKSAPEVAIGHYFLGAAQQAAGFPDLAKSSFSHALELQPQMASAAGALASLAARSGNNDEALRLAENARKTAPHLPSADLATAQALVAKGDVGRAEAALQDALGRDPSSLPTLATLLKLYIQTGRSAEAVRRIAGLVQQYPQKAGLHFLLGLAYFSLKDLDRAEPSVRQALKLDAQTPDAYTLLANIALARGSAEEAKSLLRTAIASSPRKLMNYMALVTQYEKEGNWEEAKRLCEKAHELDRTSPLVAAELAFLYLEHGGDVNTAVSLAQIAKQKLPDSPITADALGWAYYKLGSPGSAVVQLKESSEKVPSNPIYRYHLGMAYLAARRFDLAGQSLQAALRTDPHFPYAANARAALEQIPKGVH
ncbi:MAG: tetratricopeptide repeat protein [Acidobacteriia bacterium]|nr:tetratricopeptide repeat protein [Terriglobia bacterium]